MASLADLLPKPKNAAPVSYEQQLKQQQANNQEKKRKQEQQQQQQQPQALAPPYGQRHLGKWIPKKQSDFGDGGAYPEIHVAQFPLGMGRKDKVLRETSNNTLALVIDPSQSSNSSVALHTSQQIVRHGQRKDKIIYSNYTDLIEHQVDDNNLMKPSEEEVSKNTEETKQALEKILQSKIAATHKGKHHDEEDDQPSYFRYTSATGTESRIVKVAEARIDPMEPARFQTKKMPRGPPSPPVTVMHSPDKKLTKEEIDNWKIAPCISNWKNPKGYTIPLHQRLASDGRGMNEVQASNNFAKFAESLYIAEREARKDIEARAELQRRLLLKQQEAKEEKLRQLAQRARTARFGGSTNYEDKEEDNETSQTDDARNRARNMNESGTESDSDKSVDEEESKRNRLREERAKEHRYEKRKNKRKGVSLANDDDTREITEKIALGQAAATGSMDEVDRRLTNQASGLTSGFSADDSYNIYDKPLTRGSSANQIYRPTREAMEAYGGGMNDLEADMEGEGGRFTSGKTKSFKGLDGEASGRSGLGPVQFERERSSKEEETTARSNTRHHHREDDNTRSEQDRRRPREEQDDDIFGFGKYMADAKEGKKGTFDHIGKGGFMRATGGSASSDPEYYRNSKRRKIDFQSGRK